MLRTLCIYGIEMSRSIVVGSMLSCIFFLIAGWGELDRNRRRWMYVIASIFLLLAIFFPHAEVWKEWLQLAKY